VFQVSDGDQATLRDTLPSVMVVISNKSVENDEQLKAAIKAGKTWWPKGISLSFRFCVLTITRSWCVGLLVVCGQDFSNFMSALAHRGIQRSTDPSFFHHPATKRKEKEEEEEEKEEKRVQEPERKRVRLDNP